MEHGFAEERTTQGHTVESSHQAVILIALDGMGVADLVHRRAERVQEVGVAEAGGDAHIARMRAAAEGVGRAIDATALLVKADLAGDPPDEALLGLDPGMVFIPVAWMEFTGRQAIRRVAIQIFPGDDQWEMRGGKSHIQHPGSILIILLCALLQPFTGGIGALPIIEVVIGNAGADFVKTATGFSSGGATAEDVALMRKIVGPNMGVKASGGIKSLADAKTMIGAGANRIGTSAGVQIIKEARSSQV